MTISKFAAALTALALAGCAGEAPAPPKAAKASALDPGEYEVTRTVAQLAATGQAPPKTGAAVGATSVVRACVTGDTLPAAMFAEEGDACETRNSYVRGGKVSLQLSCTRPGVSGQVIPAVDGDFEAQAFDARVRSATYLEGPGDYTMTMTLEGKRIGDCPAAR